MGRIKDTKLLKAIAVELKQLRESKKKTQYDIFLETKIHIGRIETAKSNVSVSTLAALCKYFKIPLSEFHKRIEDNKIKPRS